MISKNNYFDKVDSIDYNSLPEALKEGYDTIKFGSKEHTTWKYLDDDKEFLKLYFEKLNTFLNARKPANEKSKAPGKTKPTKAKSKSGSKPKTGKTATKKKANQPEPEKVERTSDEIRFIKRYVLLNGKVKTKHQILLIINALQKAITEKRIRKTSTYANEIIHIQDELVHLYNKMPEQVNIELNKDILEQYSSIAESQKQRLSISYIKRFISLHGKTGVKEKAKRLLSQIEKAIDKGKVNSSDPYIERLKKVQEALGDYIKGKTTTPFIAKAELNGLLGIVENNGSQKKKSLRLV